MTPTANTAQSKVIDNTLCVTRTFDAPRERVWEAWTNPEHVRHWWGPKDFTAPVARIDFRVGGKYVNSMRAPDGQEYWSTGTYLEIVPMERIVCTDSFADKDGNPVHASEIGIVEDVALEGEWPMELKVTVEFEDLGGKTRLTLWHEGIPAGTMREMTGVGWSESLEKLARVLEELTRG